MSHWKSWEMHSWTAMNVISPARYVNNERSETIFTCIFMLRKYRERNNELLHRAAYRRSKVKDFHQPLQSLHCNNICFVASTPNFSMFALWIKFTEQSFQGGSEKERRQAFFTFINQIPILRYHSTIEACKFDFPSSHPQYSPTPQSSEPSHLRHGGKKK